MQVFVRNVKAGASDTYPLLRQAKRLDKVIAPVLAPPPQEIEEGVTRTCYPPQPSASED